MNININANMYYNNSINEHINRVTSVRGHSWIIILEEIALKCQNYCTKYMYSYS